MSAVLDARADAVLAQVREATDASVQIIAVTKRQPLATVQWAAARGFVLGANYVQEWQQMMAQVPHATWHFIGRLQRNKVKQVVGACALIHSVDSERLLLAIDAAARAKGLVQDVLLQVNIAGEDTKAGFAPPALADAVAIARGLTGVRVQGLMAMPPLATAEAARRHFDAVAKLASESNLAELSMGTSGDFAAALAAGATMIRLGSALLGPRSN